jgi:uncharacterized protein (DUF1778 family)
MKEDNTIFVRIDPKIKSVLKQLADLENRSLSNYVATLILEHINMKKNSANSEHNRSSKA